MASGPMRTGLVRDLIFVAFRSPAFWSADRSIFGKNFSGTGLFRGKGLGLTRLSRRGRFREDQSDSRFKINFPCFRTKIVFQDVAVTVLWLNQQTFITPPSLCPNSSLLELKGDIWSWSNYLVPLRQQSRKEGGALILLTSQSTAWVLDLPTF